MRTWTPADIWEAEAQRQAAANLERQQAGGVAANGAAALSDVPFKVGLGIGTVLLLAGGAVALYLALKR